jgi:hypothetical protein
VSDSSAVTYTRCKNCGRNLGGSRTDLVKHLQKKCPVTLAKRAERMDAAWVMRQPPRGDGAVL